MAQVNDSDSDSVEYEFGGADMSTTELRVSLFRASLARLIAALVLVGTFWIAYTWLIVSILLTMTFGVIGATHFASQDALYHSHCCCAPRPAVLFLYYATFVSIPLALIGVISSMVGVISGADGATDTLLSIVVLVDCMLLLLVEIFFFFRSRTMRARMNSEDEPYDIGGNQVAPEVVEVWAYRGDQAHGEVIDGGNALPRSYSTRGEGSLSRRASSTRPVVFGYPVAQEIHISVQPSPFTRGPPSSTAEGLVCQPDPQVQAIPDYVTTTGMLGYSSAAMPLPSPFTATELFPQAAPSPPGGTTTGDSHAGV